MKKQIAYAVLPDGNIIECTGVVFTPQLRNPQKDKVFGFTKGGMDYSWVVEHKNKDVSAKSGLFWDKASAQAAAEKILLSTIKNYLNFDSKKTAELSAALVGKIQKIK